MSTRPSHHTTVCSSQPHQAKHNAVPGKWHKAVGGDATQQAAFAQQCAEKRKQQADSKHRHISPSALEIDRYGLGLTRRVTHGHLPMIEGSHLFSIEHPLATAAAVDEEITRMLQAKAPGLNKA